MGIIKKKIGRPKGIPAWNKGIPCKESTKEKLRQANLGKEYSEEYKKNMSNLLKGRIFTEEHRSNLSKSKKKENHHFYGKKLTEEHKKKLSDSLKGNKNSLGIKHSKSARENMAKSKIGLKRTEETKNKLSIINTGSRNPNWKGGKTKYIVKLRMTKEYRLWREAVFTRDNWTCIWCGARSKKGTKVILNADHIKPFAHYPELRFAIDNGRTLCVSCHRKTETFGNKSRFFQPNTKS